MSKTRASHECFLVALEGADRVGKATQAKLLEGALRAARVRVTVEEIPYKDGVTYSEIYRFLQEGGVREFPQVFQTLHAVNRRNFEVRYLPALTQHFDVVVLDRWSLSTRIYGAVDGVSDAVTEAVLHGIREPHFTVVLDAAPWPKSNLDLLEANLEFQVQVRAGYQAWCAKHPENSLLVNASRNRDVVHTEISKAVLDRYQTWKSNGEPHGGRTGC